MEHQFGAKTTGTEVAVHFQEAIKGRVFLITGVSPSSLGGQLAITLSKHSPRLLILASRTPANILTVAARIFDSCPYIPLHVDFSSFASVRAAAQRVTEDLANKYDEPMGIDVIFNTAGINISERRIAEGEEMQFVTNHLGPFLFTSLLLPLLTPKGAGKYQSRIVNTASEAHRISPIRFSDLTQEPGYFWGVPDNEQPRKGLPEGMLRNDGRYEPSVAYGMSKTANLLMVVGLRKRLEEKGLGCWAVNPGNIMTTLTRGLDEQALDGLKKLTEWKTFDQGIATMLVAALDPDLDHSQGIYLDDCCSRNPSRWASDEMVAKKLWAISEEKVGLKKNSNCKRDESKL